MEILRQLVYGIGLCPSVWQLPNPLKHYEFVELRKGVEFTSAHRILDLGCGSGIQAQLLAAAGPTVVGIDPEEKYIRNANKHARHSRVRNRIQFFNGTVADAAIDAGSLDYVFSFCVMEHIPDLDRVLQVLRRALKPGGEIHATLDCLGNVRDEKLKERHRQMYKVQRYFSTSDIEPLFGAAGFRILENRYIQRSAWCVGELERQVLGGQSRWPLWKRSPGLRQLLEAESHTPEDQPGLMVLCRLKNR